MKPKPYTDKIRTGREMQRIVRRAARKVIAGRGVAPKDIRAEWVHVTEDGERKRLS